VKKKPIKILKKPTGSVRFRFYKPETEKTKLNPNRKNPCQSKKQSQTNKTEPNRFESVFVQKKNRKRSVSTGFDFFKIQFGYFF